MAITKKRLREIVAEELSNSKSELNEGLSQNNLFSIYEQVRNGILDYPKFESLLLGLMGRNSSEDSEHAFDAEAFAQSREE